MLIASGLVDHRPDAANPLLTLWYLLFLFSLAPNGILLFEILVPIVLAMIFDFLILRRLVGPKRRSAHDWTVLAVVLVLGLTVQHGSFALGQAVVAIPAHTRLVLPKVVWVIYWVIVLPYAVDATFGFACHLLISAGLGTWLGLFLYRVATE